MYPVELLEYKRGKGKECKGKEKQEGPEELP
jgi:hypothetical protein